MEIFPPVFQWLTSLNIMQDGYVAKRKKSGVVLTQQAANAVLSGHVVYYVCYNVAYANGVQLTQTIAGVPGEPVAPQIAHYNWSVLGDVLGSMGHLLGGDTRALLSAGDGRVACDVIADLFNRYSGQPPVATSSGSTTGATAAAPASTATTRGARARRTGNGPRKAAGKQQQQGVDQQQQQQQQQERSAGAGGVLGVVNNREGAVSVDIGLQRMREREAEAEAAEAEMLLGATGGSAKGTTRVSPGPGSRKFNALDDLERVRQKRLQRLQREQEREERRRLEEVRAAEVRAKIRDRMDWARSRLDEVTTAEVLPVYREHTNRGDVLFCHGILLELIDDVQSGAAQQRLAQREQERAAARRAARERARRGNRLVDTSKGHITMPRGADRKTVLMCHELLLQHVVLPAMQPNIRTQLEAREAQRHRDRAVQQQTMQRLVAQREDRVKAKYDEQLKAAEAERQRVEAERQRKYDRERRLNEQRAQEVASEIEQRRLAKLAEEEIEREKRARKEAEAALYHAEQKAKVLELRRRRALEEEAEAARRRREEAELVEQRRQRGAALNRKLQEKELATLGAMSRVKEAPPSLTPVNHGTGEHAAYYGETLGWQYLTEAEFDIATLFAQVRAEPQSAVPWLQQRISDIERGRTLWFTDEGGQRHPMALSSGGLDAHHEAVAFLQRQRPVKPVDDVSIGLTLAARQHAIDLAFHGVADASRHTGSDGSSLSQRVLRYGAPAVRPGSAEIIISVVRPDTLRLSPAAMLSQALVDDANTARTNRENLFHPTMVESVGVGHAIAACKGRVVVETIVLVLSHSFIDKPVAWMSQAQHNGLAAIAEPFLAGVRRCHPSITSKRHLYSTENVAIGQVARAADFARLAQDAPQRHRRSSTGATGEADEARDGRGVSDDAGRQRQQQQQQQRRQRRKGAPAAAESSSDADTSVTRSQGGSPSPVPRDPTTTATTTAQQRRAEYRARLVRFYSHHAPHKLPIVDAALTMYDGREEAMFFTLVRKYGAEPAPDDEVPDPAAAQRATEAAEPTTQERKPIRASISSALFRVSEEPVRRHSPTAAAKAPRQQRTTRSHRGQAAAAATAEAEEAEKAEEAVAAEAAPSADSGSGGDEGGDKENSVAAPAEIAADLALLGGSDRRARLVGMFYRYAPGRLASVNATLARYSTLTDTELIEALVRKYGPEPMPAELLALRAERENTEPDTLGKADAPTEGRGQNSSRDDEKEVPPSPPPPPAAKEERASSDPPGADGGGGAGADEKNTSLDRPGTPESLGSDGPDVRAAAVPDAAKNTTDDERPKKEEGEGEREEEDSEPDGASTGVSCSTSAAAPASSQTFAQYRQRLARFYTKYCPEKVPHVERLLAAYQGKERPMFLALVRKYGPEPTRVELPLEGDEAVPPMADEPR